MSTAYSPKEHPMKDKHPGGIATTRHLLSLAQLNPCRILDMGAGNGQSVELLRELGFDAVGIDLLPVHPDFQTNAALQFLSEALLQGDFLCCLFADQSFDAIISECTFYVSGNPEAALREAARLLKPGGTLLLADVSPLPVETQVQTLLEAGFAVKQLEDITPLWKEYYLSCIWDGTADELCCCQSASGIPANAKFRYYLTICERM